MLRPEEIRMARHGAGLTLEELAHRVGVALNTAWKWEAGRAKPHKIFERELRRILAIPRQAA